MKDWQYHLANSAIAGSLVTFGSILPLMTGNADFKGICIGVGVGIITGTIVFLNKFNDWFKTQDPECPTNLKLMNFI